ncbi:hypothetical protein ACRALDRAFT_2017849 [Sodiomyces alcalophilus JCM 7366]|uniref:uncharacterized protein n=1 Tax=Sodiomyces alcalophilus JCM 7366 TaxID=591952 RepID=UPI0039B6D693
MGMGECVADCRIEPFRSRRMDTMKNAGEENKNEKTRPRIGPRVPMQPETCDDQQIQGPNTSAIMETNVGAGIEGIELTLVRVTDQDTGGRESMGVVNEDAEPHGDINCPELQCKRDLARETFYSRPCGIANGRDISTRRRADDDAPGVRDAPYMQDSQACMVQLVDVLAMPWWQGANLIEKTMESASWQHIPSMILESLWNERVQQAVDFSAMVVSQVEAISVAAKDSSVVFQKAGNDPLTHKELCPMEARVSLLLTAIREGLGKMGQTLISFRHLSSFLSDPQAWDFLIRRATSRRREDALFGDGEKKIRAYFSDASKRRRLLLPLWPMLSANVLESMFVQKERAAQIDVWFVRSNAFHARIQTPSDVVQTPLQGCPSRAQYLPHRLLCRLLTLCITSPSPLGLHRLQLGNKPQTRDLPSHIPFYTSHVLTRHSYIVLRPLYVVHTCRLDRPIKASCSSPSPFDFSRWCHFAQPQASNHTANPSRLSNIRPITYSPIRLTLKCLPCTVRFLDLLTPSSPGKRSPCHGLRKLVAFLSSPCSALLPFLTYTRLQLLQPSNRQAENQTFYLSLSHCFTKRVSNTIQNHVASSSPFPTYTSPPPQHGTHIHYVRTSVQANLFFLASNPLRLARDDHAITGPPCSQHVRLLPFFSRHPHPLPLSGEAQHGQRPQRILQPTTVHETVLKLHLLERRKPFGPQLWAMDSTEPHHLAPALDLAPGTTLLCPSSPRGNTHCPETTSRAVFFMGNCPVHAIHRHSFSQKSRHRNPWNPSEKFHKTFDRI